MQCENNINNTERNYLLLETNLVVAIGKELELLFAQCMRSLRFCCVRILQTYLSTFSSISLFSKVLQTPWRQFALMSDTRIHPHTLKHTHTHAHTHSHLSGGGGTRRRFNVVFPHSDLFFPFHFYR